jgi:RecB family exonuclease
MSDDVDIANDRTQLAIDAKLQEISDAAKLDKGVEGDCELCGEWTSRLIGDACAPCRDKYKLK